MTEKEFTDKSITLSFEFDRYLINHPDIADKIPLKQCTDGFHFDTQILILFHARKFKIKEISIPTFYGNEVSHVKIFSYGLKVLNETIQYRLQKTFSVDGLYASFPRSTANSNPNPINK